MTRLVALALLALVACSKTTPEPEKVRAEEAPASATAAAPAASAAPVAPSPAAAAPGDVAYDPPSAWQSAPNPNQMRKATFKVPKVAGDPEDAELSVSVASGGVDANVTRWAGQFGNATPKKDSRSPNGLKVTVVELAGTYSSGGMMGPATPKEHWMLLGAVVEAGEQLHFFKLTGPEKTVQAARKDFDTFVASFRAK
ncbi:MAG: hypothetical protein KIT84_01065 [Labilithrix sp.]|nr:hypothetical protein [Labilithrix sp.]MCW5809575.1 hypothetical protein [Labilithrix sp.]